MADDSSDLSSLSSLSPVPSDLDSEPEPEPQPKKGTILKFFNKLPKGQKATKAAKEASPPPRKRSPSPAHEYVFADNPDIAFIVMFRSRFNEVFPKSLSNFGPQELETDITDSPPGQRVENFLCALLGLLLNRKQDVKPGHYMRALEDALSSHRHRWPKEWEEKSPFSGGIGFNDLGNTQRLTLLRVLIHWTLSDSEAIKAMIAKAYKQNRHEDDRNQALSVQPWGSDSDKRRYFLVEGLDDTAFRVYRESNPAGFNRTWWSVAGSIEELTALATKLETKDGGPKARKLAQNMMAAIPRFEATEEKRKRREYRQAQKNRFKRPSPGFSLYEGRTRGKRVKYTYSDEEDESWTDSTRRSARNTGTHTPADPAGPVTTASGRQVRAPTRLTRGSADTASVQGDESDLSQMREDTALAGNGRPRRSAAVNHGTNGWAGSGHGSSADESDPDGGGDGDDGDEHVPDESDEEDDVLNDDEMLVDDDLDERPAQLIVGLKVKNKEKLAGATLTPSPESKDEATRGDADAGKSPTKATASTPASLGDKSGTPEPEKNVVAQSKPDLDATPLAFRGSPEKTQAISGAVTAVSKD
ncbi:hypothetical protein F5X68DRAFT_161043 [Plectosphaerella plurivora]|uniref:WHIM1 domain-containing protein n=1 Tax=Plectosphaerella plurivora TaxID=936078 RepID=A0A9P9A527_9PEZI|nr:hypothetical protein F5X68DRAFT_161043 [Plectosphaerella plurivora]